MKIAIVTCYDEGEANSAYSRVLNEEFIRQGHEVKILRLPFSIFGNTSREMIELGNKTIENFVKEIPNFDYVSIHYESALYGRNPKVVLNRVFKIINACKDNCFSITVHNCNFPNDKTRGLLRKIKNKIFKPKITWQSQFLEILKAVKNKGGLVIVHDVNSFNKISCLVPDIKIVMHPLSYKRKEDIESIKKQFNKEKYIMEQGIDKINYKYSIGVLGTFSYHKDYFTVIRALKYLPEEYHLFIYGGQHSLSYVLDTNGLPQTVNMQNLINELNLADRIHFMGFQPTDEDMTNAQLFCDYIVMPHIEIGESASAGLGIALELNDLIFATRNNMFDNVKIFTGEAFWQYDMGNYMELAEKILRLPNKDRILKNKENYLNKYNITEDVKLYLSVLNNK